MAQFSHLYNKGKNPYLRGELWGFHEPLYVECWGPCLALATALLINYRVVIFIMWMEERQPVSHPDDQNVMVGKCDGQASPWAKSRAWDPDWGEQQKASTSEGGVGHRWSYWFGSSAHARGCPLSESLHQPLDLVGKAPEEKKIELGTEFIRTQKGLALSLQRGPPQCTARGRLLRSQHWVLLEGRMPSACYTGSVPDIWAKRRHFLQGQCFSTMTLGCWQKQHHQFPRAPMCVLIRMIIRNNDSDYHHHCVLYLWAGRGSELCTHDLGASHTVLPPVGRWPVCLSRWGSGAPRRAAQAHTATPQGEGSPTHRHVLPQALLVPNFSWANAFDILKHHVMDSASGASLVLNVNFGI